MNFDPQTIEHIIHHNWRNHANCQGRPTHWWYPPKGGSRKPETLQALRLCKTCPVQTECLTWALITDTRNSGGIYAATTWRQRQTLRTKLTRQGNPPPRLIPCRTCGRLYPLYGHPRAKRTRYDPHPNPRPNAPQCPACGHEREELAG